MANQKGKKTIKQRGEEDLKVAVVDMAWKQLQGLIGYAQGLIDKNGFEKIFNESHPEHEKWKKALVNKSLEYAKDVAVKSMPTELTGDDGGPIRLLYRAAPDLPQ